MNVNVYVQVRMRACALFAEEIRSRHGCRYRRKGMLERAKTSLVTAGCPVNNFGLFGL
jgi:hypothetical protein